MSRAYGSHAQLLGVFESSYGTAPASGFYKLPFISCSLGSEQGLINNDVLGYGRDPQAPIRDVIVNEGNIQVPVDTRNFGFWLKAMLGAPTTTDNYAKGTIAFSANPSDGDTITINGVVWTFKTSASLAEDIQIGATLDDTLFNAVGDLNASADVDVSEATYSLVADTDEILVTHDAPGTSGNSFTLAASAATVSAATLQGGGAKVHTFVSGSDTIPSMSLEVGMSQASAYFMNSGVVVNSMEMSFARSGRASATFNLIGQGEERNASSQGGSPSTLALKRFNQFQGEILKGTERLGNVTRSTVNYSNNLERIETIRDDGKIEGVDPTIAALTGEIDVRFADTVLLSAAEAFTALELKFKYTIDFSNQLIVTAHEVYLPKPKQTIEGPGGVQATFNWQAADDLVEGQMMTIELINDVESYA